MNFDEGVIIIAPHSLVGSRFIEQLSAKSIPVEKIDHHSADITDLEQLTQSLSKSSGKVVINFAAATAVDEIEKTRPVDPSDPDQLNNNQAYLINVVGTKNLMQACQNLGKLPVFISTDFVFDGQSGPYQEDDAVAISPDQISWYGWTKLLAEKEIDLVNCLNIRIAYPYRREYDLKGDLVRNFLENYDRFVSGETPKLMQPFADQQITPTLIDDLMPAITFLINQDQRGIFHLASPEVVNLFDFYCECLKLGRGVEHPEEILQPGSLSTYLEQFPEKAKRPVKGGLISQKIIDLGFQPTNWQEGLAVVFAENNQ